jgi:hypothetical protein
MDRLVTFALLMGFSAIVILGALWWGGWLPSVQW